MSGKSRIKRLVPDQLWTETATVRSVVALAHEQQLPHMAAGIAYYAFVSMIPLLLLIVAVSSVLGGEPLADHVTDLIGQQLSPSGRLIVSQTLTDNTGRGTASLVGFLILTWNSLRVFRGLNQGVEGMYPNAPDSSLLEQLRDTLVVGLGLVAAVVLVAAITVVLSVPSLNVPFADVFGKLALFAVLLLVLLPIYYVLPPIETSIREILAGTAVAALGWSLLQTGFQIYVANAGQYGAYGVIGALLLFVTLLYFASIIVLLGAAVNAVRHGGQTRTQ